ncbi:MAG: hypothetical protein ACI305_01470 [Lepagella sp.]
MNKIAKILIAVMLAVITSSSSYAQGEMPLVREGIKWHYVSHCETYPAPAHHYCFFDGSKEIDGKQYSICHWIITQNLDTTWRKCIYMRQEGKQVFMRIDSLKHQVFDYPFYFGPDVDKDSTDKECLLYDFALNAGQSWKLFPNYSVIENEGWDAIGAGNNIRIDSVGQITVCGINTKVQYIHSPLAIYGKIVVVEGIGPLNNNIFPLPYTVDVTYKLIYPFTYLVALEDNKGNVMYDPSGVKDVIKEQTLLSVEGNRLSVDAEGDWSLTVFGADGSKAGTYRGNGQQAIELPFVPGLYIAVLTDRNGSQKLKFML